MASFKSTSTFSATIIALLVLFGRADAQPQKSLRDLIAPVPTVAEALADEYGQAIIAELARLMSQRADLDCLKLRGIAESDLKQSAGEILIRHGIRVRALLYPEGIDDAIEAEFIRLAGPQAVEEMRKLASHPGVRRYYMLRTPLANDDLVNAIANAFDGHLVRLQLQLEQDLSPFGDPQSDLILFFEKRAETFEDFLVSTKDEDWATPHTLLMVNFSDAHWQVIKKSGQPPTHAAFEGVEATLRATCVRLGND